VIKIALLLIGVLFMNTAAYAESFTLWFSRHAEKTDEKEDPKLTAAGQVRANQLAIMLQHAGVEAVYSTDTLRTQLTATPTAEQSGVTIQLYDHANADALARTLMQKQENALIIGHSNTIPDLVRLFDGEAPDLSEEEFGDVFQVVIAKDKFLHTRLTVGLPLP